MFNLKTFKIDLKAMTDDCIKLDTAVDDDYFAALEGAEIQKGRVDVAMSIRKASDSFDLTIKTEGQVIVTCDRCLEEMEQDVAGESHFKVRLGKEPVEDDELIVVDENEGILDTAWLIYETIALAVPIKHVHAPGKCNAAMIEKLQELSATRSGDEAADQPIDPRWAALSKLKE